MNVGFQPPSGRRVAIDIRDATSAVACGRCEKTVPDGRAHLVVNFHYAGAHQLFCPGCCPCRRKPKSVKPFQHQGDGR